MAMEMAMMMTMTIINRIVPECWKGCEKHKYKNYWTPRTIGTGFIWGNDKEYVETAHHIFEESDHDDGNRKKKENNGKKGFF